MTPIIKFGTDGWRGVIADDFTFANLDRVAFATARYFRKHKKIRNGILLGYDARFMGKEFARRVAEVIANTGIKVVLADAVSSTPMVSLLTKLDNAAAGVVITASHNPPRYSGFKIKGEFGGPAHPEMIAAVEKELARVLKLKKLPPLSLSYDRLVAKGKIVTVGMTKRYVDDLAGKIDLERIRRSGLRIVYDSMYGAGTGSAGRGTARSGAASHRIQSLVRRHESRAARPEPPRTDRGDEAGGERHRFRLGR